LNRGGLNEAGHLAFEHHKGFGDDLGQGLHCVKLVPFSALWQNW